MSTFNTHFRIFIKELNSERYCTYTIYDLLNKESSSLDPYKLHVGIRFDVDSGLELCDPLTEELVAKNLKASFYFLTHPERYYDIWNSQIPRLVYERGFEVGVHSDHYYEELMFGTNALAQIKQDITKLSEMIGHSVYGITAHGHAAIERASECIWDVYKHLDPQELGVEYHDGILENMEQLKSVISIQDYLGVPNGWQYWPAYPRHALRRVPSGSIVFFKIHPQNFFVPDLAKTRFIVNDFQQHIYHFIRIRARHQFVGTFIGEGKSARQELKRLFKLGKQRD